MAAKPTPPAPPVSTGDAVRAGKVDGALAARVAGGAPTRAIVTVRFADVLQADKGRDASAHTIAANGATFAQRKDAVLRAVPGLARLHDYGVLPTMVVRVDSPTTLQELASSPGVVSVQADGRNHADLAQSLPLIRQPQVAADGHKGAGTAVAVLDTGVDYTNSAFGSCSSPGGSCTVAYAHDFAPDDGARDDDGHGTNVAGIVHGVAPDAKVLALDVFDGGGAADSDILDAIDWVIGNAGTYHIKSMNLSLGDSSHNVSECTGSSYSAPFEIARNAGILPIVAAGNDGYVNGSYVDGVSSPACASDAVRVGAVYDSDLGSEAWVDCTDNATRADKITCFSQSGPLLSLLAPGSEITAAGITESGTSQATPHVAGAAAVLGEVNPSASAWKVEHALVTSGPAITDARNGITRHRLDLVDAVASVQTPDAVVRDPDCAGSTLAANDDGSTGAVPLPFAVNFFGTQYGELYVNNNGNVTFNAPMGTYTPFSITANVPPMIAPFFADVDTRGGISSLVTYGATTYGGRPAFCVDWDNVGYYAERTDKTNSFQLLLVDRSNIGAGDFDIIMNYDRLAWETGEASGGSDGLGGTPAGAGYSAGDGNTAHFYELPGSLTHDGLLDDNPQGLVNGSRGSQQHGRYVFPIRNGLAPGNATIEGDVTGPDDQPLASAPVQACLSATQCVTTRTGSDGHYSLSALSPGTYDVRALPPSGSSLTPAERSGVALADAQVTTVDLQLQGPARPPAGTTITDRGTTADGIPILNWHDELTLTTQACAGGSVSYSIVLDGRELRSGAMTESPAGSGQYAATVAALYPNTGNATTTITRTCPNPADSGTISFDIYIDPSGVVEDTHGRPLAGATVTLLRSDLPDGPFAVVPDGDAVMSPGNRSNPDTTAADGTFGWDVLAGYYVVRASMPGCTSPTDPTADHVDSAVLTIPPPVTDLVLKLDCPYAPLSVALAGSGVGTVTSAPAGIDCGSACQAELPQGTTVTLTAAPAAGSHFAGWGGACSGTTPTCSVSLDAATTVTAAFDLDPGPPTAPPAGGGPATIPPPLQYGAPSVMPPCVVPKLHGKTLAAARTALAKAGCRLGKVRHAASREVRRGRVVSQALRAGRSKPVGTKVRVVVSSGKRHHRKHHRHRRS